MKFGQKDTGRPAPRAGSILSSHADPSPLAGLGARLARTGALGVAAVIVGFLACGCGASAEDDTTVRITTKVNEPAATKNAHTQVQAVTANAKAPASQVAAKSHAVANAPDPQERASVKKIAQGLPPDIVIARSDSAAAPGEVVYITVRATEDVTQIVMRDGIGDSQGLVYDEDARLWRLTYRIPLSTPWERVGLSFTAKNRDERWCRVWTFVRVKEDPSNHRIRLTVGS